MTHPEEKRERRAMISAIVTLAARAARGGPSLHLDAEASRLKREYSGAEDTVDEIKAHIRLVAKRLGVPIE